MKTRKTIKVLIVLALALCAGSVRAQRLAVKVNALNWASTSFQAGVEGAVHPRWTVEATGAWQPWSFDRNRKFKNIHFRVEPRFWLWEAFNGHYFGVNMEFSQYNTGGMKANPFVLMFPNNMGDVRYEGIFFGPTVTYG